ncbi:MAG: hypothetical protein ACM3QY_01455, partial [Candidatus Levyibacteriota bacterium]
MKAAALGRLTGRPSPRPSARAPGRTSGRPSGNGKAVAELPRSRALVVFGGLAVLFVVLLLRSLDL